MSCATKDIFQTSSSEFGSPFTTTQEVLLLVEFLPWSCLTLNKRYFLHPDSYATFLESMPTKRSFVKNKFVFHNSQNWEVQEWRSGMFPRQFLGVEFSDQNKQCPWEGQNNNKKNYNSLQPFCKFAHYIFKGFTPFRQTCVFLIHKLHSCH